MGSILELAMLLRPAIILAVVVAIALIIININKRLTKIRPQYGKLISMTSLIFILSWIYLWFYLAFPHNSIEVFGKAIISLPFIFIIPGYILYSIFVNNDKAFHFSDVVFLQVLASILISGWFALLLAELGHFSLMNLLILIIIFSILLKCKFKIKFSITSYPIPKLNNNSIALVLILLLSIAFFFHPYEFIVGGADAGVYVNIGANVAKTGSIIIHNSLIESIPDAAKNTFYLYSYKPTPILDSLDPHYQGIQFPGFYITDEINGKIVPQFYHLYPIIRAIFYTIFGLKASLYILPLLGLLSIMGVYLLGKSLFHDDRIGLVAALLLCLNIAQIWIARYPTSEILAQFLIISGIYTFVIFNRNSNGLFGILSGLCFGEAFLNKIDAVLLLIPIISFFIYINLENKLNKRCLFFVVPFLLLIIHSLLHAFYFTRPYAFAQIGARIHMSLPQCFGIFLIVLMIIILLGIILNKYRDILLSIITSYQYIAKHVSAMIIIILAIYGYFIRPLSAEYKMSNNGELIRTFNETNFVELGWYLTDVGLLLAVAGVILLIYKKPYKENYFFLGIVLPYSIFYIHNSIGSPGHLYIIRYFMPVIIPSFVILISYVLISIYNVNKKEHKFHYEKLISLTLFLILIVSFINTDRIILGHIDYEGIIDQTANMSSHFDNNDIILFKNAKYYDIWMSTPLQYIFGKNTFTIQPKMIDESFGETLGMWYKDGRDVYFVDSPPSNLKLKNFVFLPKAKYMINVPWLENFGDHLPHRIAQAKHVFVIHQLTSISDILTYEQEPLQVSLGDSGWHDLEDWGGIPTHWLENDATIIVYSDENRTINLSFKAHSFYRPRTLEIFSNDLSSIATDIPSEGFVMVNVSSISLNKGANIVRLHVREGCERPCDIPKLNNGDPRCLSVAVQNISI